MTLKIYGTAASRAARPLWAAQEMGLAYEHIALPYVGGATRTPEFLAINPNGRIPVVDDDGVLVWSPWPVCFTWPSGSKPLMLRALPRRIRRNRPTSCAGVSGW